jgi:shikimate kinase
MERIALLGLMGSGKTTVGQALARQLGWRYRDNDHELLARFGASAADLAERHGIVALHAAEAAVLLDVLGTTERSVITAAASTLERPACRRALAEKAFVVWLRAKPVTLAARATPGSGRPWEDDIELQLRRQARRRHPLLERLADLTVDTTELDGERIAAQIVQAFERTRQPTVSGARKGSD